MLKQLASLTEYKAKIYFVDRSPEIRPQYIVKFGDKTIRLNS